MKPALVVVTSVVLACAIASSCSISHRSQDFACTSTSQCATGRMCVDGFCVDGTGQADAAKGSGSDAKMGSGSVDAPVPPTCPPGCTSCNVAQKTCTIDCALDPAACDAQVVCPDGYSCTIKCNVLEACRGGIDCLNAAACVINCSGQASCTNVTCGPGPCDVNCSGPNSCRPGATTGGVAVDCSTSCGCEVGCTGSNSCSGAVECPMLFCQGTDGGCDDTITGCYSCP